MRRVYTFIALFIFFSSALIAQDTLLFENFNTPFDTLSDDSDGVTSMPNGSNSTWVNWDVDDIQDASGRPGNWYWQEQWQGSDTMTQGGVLVSSSWLANNADGAENWLILPPFHFPDNTTMLSWKSAPFQGPRYTDGYTVVLSAFKNFPPQFTDTLFTHAQMTGIGLDTIVSTFTFSDGYVHANGFTNNNYFYYNEDLNGFNGLLEPHSVSLAPYAGFTVYIAFVHDSDDDNLMALDDILLTGTLVVSTNEVENISSIKVFPNPASNYIQANYTSTSNDAVDIRIFDIQGRMVESQLGISNTAGEFQHTIDISNLPKGTYELVFYQNGTLSTKPFIKQ